MPGVTRSRDELVESMRNSLKSLPRFCTVCNGAITVEIVDEIAWLVCMQCNRIENGCFEHERTLVAELQDDLKDQKWRIGFILETVRRYVAKREARDD